MSIFDRIKHALFREAKAADPAPAQPQTRAQTPTPAQTPAPAQPQGAAQGQSAAPAQAPARPAAPSGASSPAGSGAQQAVDIEPILEAAVKRSGQKLDWRHSIVDFMKALGMDASMEERKELAGELGYTGDMHDSAKMNMFLHKALMKRISENGGKVPPNLLD